MPPVRHNPSQRVHDRVTPTGRTLQPTAEASSQSGGAPRNTSQKQHLSPVWNGHQVTPTTHYLLSNGVDPSVLHGFSPVLVHYSSHIFDPSSSLPLPPKPNASSTQDTAPAEHARLGAGAPSDPFSLSPSSPSTAPSLVLDPPTSKLYTKSLATPPAATDAELTVCAHHPPAQPARPSNDFFLFRADYFARVNSLHLPPAHYASLPDVNCIWNQAPDAVKTYYRELAGLTKVVHGHLHPGYKYKPLKKGEKQRQKDEKARLKRETMANAKASRTTKAQGRSSRTPAAKTATPPAPKASVDVRMYDPSRRTYYRLQPSGAQSPPSPSPVGAPPTSPSSASSPSPVFSGVRNTAQIDAYHLPSSSSSQTTSPAYTLFQVEETESPPFAGPYCTTDEDADDNDSETAALWPTIEDDVDWYRVAPPHWCGPDDDLSFCDDENACNNCMSMRWSEELNIDIPTASAAPIKFTAPGYSLDLNPASYMPALLTLSSKTLSFANDSLEALLASTMEVHGDGELGGFWNGFFVPPEPDPLYNPPLPSIDYSTPPRGYTGYA